MRFCVLLGDANRHRKFLNWLLRVMRGMGELVEAGYEWVSFAWRDSDSSNNHMIVSGRSF